MLEIYLPIAQVNIDIFLLLFLSLAVGVLSGLFGVGGGFLMTPLLVLLGIPPAVAVASEANHIVGSSLSGTIGHLKRKAVDIKLGNLLLIGGIIGYLTIWLIIFLYKAIKKIDGMGLGDAKLMAGIGLLFGWQSIPLVLFISSILGLVFVIPSLIKKQKNMRSEIPFGPFIIISLLIYFVIGDFLYTLILV